MTFVVNAPPTTALFSATMRAISAFGPLALKPPAIPALNWRSCLCKLTRNVIKEAHFTLHLAGSFSQAVTEEWTLGFEALWGTNAAINFLPRALRNQNWGCWNVKGPRCF